MRKLLNKPWFVVVLVVAALGAVYLSLPEEPSYGTAPTSPAAWVPVEESSDAEATGDGTSAPNPARGLHAILRALALPPATNDPFAPRTRAVPVVAAEAPPAEPDAVDTVRLSAIWLQGDTLLVLVNDQIHTAGEVVGRLTIESADLDGIWLSHWKGRDFLRLGESFTLMTPAPHTTTSIPATHEG